MAEELFKALTPKVAAPTAEEVAAKAKADAAAKEAADKAASDKVAADLAAEEAAKLAAKEAEEEDDLKMPSELDMLKDRASLMGITFSNNIGVDALKAKIEEKRAATEAASKPAVEQAKPAATETGNGDGSVNAFTGNETKAVKTKSLRQHLRDEKLKLIRVRITNLDPKKKDLPGEILTIANEYIGTVRKFVPFGEVTDNGFHVPQCLFDMMKERTFVSIKTRKDNKGQTIVEHQNAREFALEILPQLTTEDLAQLSAAQAAAGGL